MARRLKGFRKINIDGNIHHWKVKKHYYGADIIIYDPYFNMKEITTDDCYGTINVSITPAYVEFIIRKDINVIDEEHIKSFLFDRTREKKLKRILDNG